MTSDIDMEGAVIPDDMATDGERRRSSRIRAVSGTPSEAIEATDANGPRKRSKSVDVDPVPPERALRKRKSSALNVTGADPIEESMKPLTDEERRNWKGWVELESDPALFNFMLQEYGVSDVKVQEVWDVTDEMLDSLPKPVYGLIFLFRYRYEEEEEEEEEEEGAEQALKCSRHVWFANQTSNDACATIALLNIVMNAPGINLGESLDSFKRATQGLKPARMDILNADLGLQNDFEKWEKSQKNPKRKKIATVKRKKKDEEEPGFHFIAYVPVDGKVWKLDGLQRQPINLGAAEGDWLAVARDNIQQRMFQYAEDGVQYNLLSLCKNSLQEIRQRVAESMKLLMLIEKNLDDMIPDWKAFSGSDGPQINESCEAFGLSQKLVVDSDPPASALEKIELASTDPSSLMNVHQDFLKEQARLQSSYMEEAAATGQEDEQAAKRKLDYTPRVYHAVRKLAEAGVLKDIVLDIRKNKG